MPSFREVAAERFYIVAGCGPDADEDDAKGTKNVIYKGIPLAPVLGEMRLVVELHDRNDGGGELVVDNKVYMFLT
jgi:hypothetical protein